MSSSLRATGWRSTVVDWGGGMSASSNHASSCSFTWAMDGRIVHCGIISSCQSAATSEIVKTLLATSSSRLRSAIASIGLYVHLWNKNRSNLVKCEIVLFRLHYFVRWQHKTFCLAAICVNALAWLFLSVQCQIAICHVLYEE